MKNAELLVRIQRLQHELTEMYQYNQSFLDRRQITGITTDTDSTKVRHQQTISETLALLESIKAEKENQMDEAAIIQEE